MGGDGRLLLWQKYDINQEGEYLVKNQVLPGDKVYGVEDRDMPTLVEVEVSEVLPKKILLKEGDRLFDQTYLSKHDPRISQMPIKAIKAYVIRKKRRIREMNNKKKILNIQLKTVQEMMKRYI